MDSTKLTLSEENNRCCATLIIEWTNTPTTQNDQETTMFRSGMARIWGILPLNLMIGANILVEKQVQ